ncbi:MAG: stalk domain-containing protein [Tissierellia bacterium]|nr:stalk domain-containing protein [Tissierellia bacterium]
MRNTRSLTIIMIIILILLSSVSFAEPIMINLDGSQLSMPIDPILHDGRTLVPLRPMFEALGARVDWDNDTRTVTATLDDKIIILQINNKIATVNGNEIELDVAGKLINGSTFIPVRFIAESLGAKVDWNPNSKTVIIISNTTAMSSTTYKVTRVVDGDTIKVNFNGKEESLRLIGIDTPESVHPDASRNVLEGRIASDYTKTLLEGKDIELEFDDEERDKYGRLLAYVYINGIMVNKLLLKEGYAQVSTYPPNVKYVDEFNQIQRIARENNKGLWSYE